MSRADAIITKVTKALAAVGPMDRTVYLRKVSRTGGSSLLSRGGTLHSSDELFDPQPTYTQVTHRSLMGGKTNLPLSADGTPLVVAGDWEFTFTPDAITLADIQGKNNSLILKDSAGNEEVYQIITYSPSVFGGMVVKYAVYGRSVKR